MANDVFQDRLKGHYSAAYPGLMVFEVINPGDIKVLRVTTQQVPLGGDAIFDMNKNGVSVWSGDPTQRLKILASAGSGEKSGLTIPVVKGDIITVDLDSTPSAIGESLFISVSILPS